MAAVVVRNTAAGAAFVVVSAFVGSEKGKASGCRIADDVDSDAV